MSAIETYRPFVKAVLDRYSKVSDESVALLMSISKLQQLRKGEILLQLGKVSRTKHLLFKGVVVSNFINNEGDLYHKKIFFGRRFCWIYSISHQGKAFSVFT